jgi:predicted RNA-binding protein with PIN domain
VIGAWDELITLKKSDFSGARERLINDMAEYQAYMGWRIIIVFDAHLVPGNESKNIQSKVEVIYTKENETADERIEKLVSQLKNAKTRVHVATSDMTEQWTVFSQGALRKSSRELLIEMKKIKRDISENIKKYHAHKPSSKVEFDDELSKRLERMRRGF